MAKPKVTFPEKLKIGKHEWSVIQSESHEDAEKDDLGVCVWDDKLIWISVRQSREQLICSFIHEVFHAIEYEYKIKIPHGIIYALEKPIRCFLRDNFDV
jgi:hypothetical protein